MVLLLRDTKKECWERRTASARKAMLVIGLTGGIGTGKSEVARLLQGLGALIINADLVGHEAYKPNTDSWREVVKAFGDDILRHNGEIDRRKLGAIVFSDPEQLARLNGIMHPRMARMVAGELDRLRCQSTPVAVVEAALLFEAGWDSLVDEVWVTDSPVEAVIERLQVRNGLSAPDVLKRIESQMERSARLEQAQVVVDNSADVAELKRTVTSLWNSRVKGRIAGE
jgi:dephospho-CoA kinase